MNCAKGQATQNYTQKTKEETMLQKQPRLKEKQRQNNRFPTQPNCVSCDKRAKEWCPLGGNINRLDDAKTLHMYQAGQSLYHQGTRALGLFCVESGTIALRKLDAQGNETIVRLIHPGQTLGYQALFADELHTTTAEALTKSRVCFIEKQTIQDLFQEFPQLSLSFLQRMAEDLHQAEEDRLHLTALPVRARLAHLLLLLKDYYGTINKEGDVEIELPFSRQDMASMIAARPETLSRTLRALERDGVAIFDKKKVTIKDLDDLFDELEPCGVNVR